MISFKNIKVAGWLLVLALVTQSCGDFLEENPKDRIAESNYYTTAEDAVAAVNSIYGHLNAQSGDTYSGVYHSTFWVTIGLASDEMVNNRFVLVPDEQLSTFTHNPENGNMYTIWKLHYQTIVLANTAIARIPGISMDETLRERLVNEAKFLRALMYFNLVRMYGEIPLLVKEDEPLTPSVATVDAVYAQIISDLTAAENLPAIQTEGKGRATAGAAKAILAKVYLTRKEYDKASAKALEVIDSKQYELWDDFADVFKIRNRGGKEAIFSVGFGDAGGSISFWEVGQFNVRLLPKELTDAGVTNNTQGWQAPTDGLVAAYASDDERRNVSVFNVFTEDGKNVPFNMYHFRKYWDREVEPKAEGSVQDFQVIRYADVLLMYAEASNALGNAAEAQKYINIVRDRAGLDPLPLLDKAQFEAAVLEERRLELAAEGHRWFDLVRTGKLETLVPLAKMGITPQAKHYLFPIPQRERDLNSNLPQNDY